MVTAVSVNWSVYRTAIDIRGGGLARTYDVTGANQGVERGGCTALHGRSVLHCYRVVLHWCYLGGDVGESRAGRRA